MHLHTFPVSFIPLLMMIRMVCHSSVLWVNTFLPKGGVLTTMSPHNIMTGVPFDYNKHCKYKFGVYRQAHKDNSQSNTQVGRSIRSICLGLTGNLQGSYKCLGLCTGKKHTQHKFTPLPMLLTAMNDAKKGCNVV